MTTTITIGATVITPTVVLGYASEREGGSVVHPILGSSNPDVTIRPAQLRTGTLRLGFSGATSEADSLVAASAHATGAVAALASDERTSVAMTYVLPSSGTVTRELEDVTRNAWIVVVDFQEVVL